MENKESALITTIEDKTEGFIVGKRYIVIDCEWLVGLEAGLIKELREEYGIPYKIVEVLELEE